MSNRKPTVQVFALGQPFITFESRLWRPAHNLYETDRGITMVVELAGVDPGNLHVHLHPRLIAVHGVRQLAVPEGIRRIEQMEIGAGPFRLEVALARPIDPEGGAARYSAGLLEIDVPFAQQTAPNVVVIRIEGGAQ